MRLRVVAFLLFSTAFHQQVLAQDITDARKEPVTYTLPDPTPDIYPSTTWLPVPYKKYYEGESLEDVFEHFTVDSLKRDGISFSSIGIKFNPDIKGYDVTIETNDSNASRYAVVHPQFIQNYISANQGIANCKATSGCWNKNNTHEDEPWAFFAQLGLPMAMQRSVLMLNYPPATALTQKDYLGTFTMNRWTRVLTRTGISNPVHDPCATYACPTKEPTND